MEKYIEIQKLPNNLLELYNLNSNLFNDLVMCKPKEHGKVMMYGKIIDVPRYQQSYINNYNFSGINHSAIKEIPIPLQPIYDYISTINKFNQILINWYQNGHHYIGAHSDDETQLIKNSTIISISLGETRTFRIRDKKTKKIVLDIQLEHGTIIIMNDMQKKFTHEITKVNGKKGQNLKERINITFRQFK